MKTYTSTEKIRNIFSIFKTFCFFAKSFKYRENTHTFVPFLYQIGIIDISIFFHINK